ncbi:nucleotide exchange factor GrpE [Kitasatospora indigofera]|uniref:nucleotide exchange factor GrpE n=1 Tax=Kitasatospora indigofera TaxID=67307 RepID=UPI0036A19504
MTGTDTGRPAPDLPGARLPANGLTAAQLPAAQIPGPQIPGARLPAGPDPLAIDEQPLPVPPGAAAVDLADAFGKLLFRSAFAQRKRAEEAKEAESGLRDLLLGLLEVDDALGAIAGPELQPAPYPERLLGAPVPATAQAQAGVAATRRLLRLKLARAGVRPMSFDNRLANTAVSEIVATTPVAGMPEDTVVEVVQAGFFWQDQVLRRARVVVSVLPEELPEEPSEELPEVLSDEPPEESPAGPAAEPAPEPVPESEPEPEPESEPEPSPEAVATERPRPVRKQPKRQPSRAKRRTTAGVGAGSGAGSATAGTVAGTTGEASTDTVTTDTVTNDSTITDTTTDTGSTGTGNTGG